ncbi:nestin [Rhinoderma darwinii]|uniref:nestin n=1 Tax=Rhinoderma darwinii TaxID=43563 RepID=UPI003F674EC4
MSRMETYPTTISLGEESAQMWTLNKRLEAYLSRVKALEEENELLRSQIHHLKSTRSEKCLIRKHHDEIMKLRHALDDGHQEMVQVEIDRDSIYQEVEYVKELCLQEKQAQEDVKKELSESKKVLEEEKRAQIWLKERLSQLEREMEDIFKSHEEEKAEMEEEILSYSQRLENFKIAPVNFTPVNLEDYSNKLSEIWQGAVEDYKNEVSAMEEHLSQAKENLKKVLEENKQSQLQQQNLDRDLQCFKDRKEMLEELLAKQWLEQQEEEGRLQLEVETLEEEKQDLRVQIAQVLEDRQQLMHLKMSLSLEVATYRSLLEAESTRLYTPSADYKISSPFNGSVLEQNTFRKRQHENTKPLVSKAKRFNKKQSAELSSTNRYLNVKSTSFSNRASPVTKEFQKVSSVLQSQVLNYTKAPHAKAATTLPAVESNLGRYPQKVVQKSKVETISQSSSRDSSEKTVTEVNERKDIDIPPVLNGNAFDTTDAGLKKTDHRDDAKGKFLPPIEKEVVNAQLESSLKPEGKHIQVITDFVLEEQQSLVETQNKGNDTIVFEKLHKEKIDFEGPQANDDRPGEGFRNIDKEHIIENHEVIRHIVSYERDNLGKEELVGPPEYQNMETSIKVSNEEFQKVLDFSKPNTKDMDGSNVLSSDGVSDQGIESSANRDLDLDTQVSLNNADVDNASHDKEDINQGVDEEKESVQLNKGFGLSNTDEASDYVDLRDKEVTIDEKVHVLSSSKEDSDQFFDDGQNVTKDFHDEKKSEMEQCNEHPKKNIKDVSEDTNIQEYNDKELDQQSSRQDEDILDGPHSMDIKSEVQQRSDDKLEYTPFDQERQEGFELCDASDSIGRLSNEEDFKKENKKEEEDYEREENINNAEQNIHDSTHIEQSRILVVREVYQSNYQVLDDLEEAQHQRHEEKNSFELSDLEQISHDDQQRTDFVKATQEFSDTNQEESEDLRNKEVFEQLDNDQKEVGQLYKEALDSPQPDLEDIKSVDLSDIEQVSQQIEGDYIENKPVVQTLDIEEGDNLQDIIRQDTDQLSENVEESLISHEEYDDIQKLDKEIEQSDLEPQSVQLTLKEDIQSSKGEELEKDDQSLERDLNEEDKEGGIKTSTVELKSYELKVGVEDKDEMSRKNFEDCTAVEYTKSIKTEVIVQSIHEEYESYDEDNITEKYGPTPTGGEEDIYTPEHEAEKEQQQGKEHYEDEYKDLEENEEDKQLVQKESDVELNIAKEDGFLLKQETEPIVEGQSEVWTSVNKDVQEDNAKVDDVHQGSEVNEDQATDIKTSFQHGSEDLVQSDGEKDNEDISEVAPTTEEGTLSKEGEIKQSVKEEYDIVEEVQANITQESQLLKNEANVELDEVVGNDQEDNRSFNQEVEEEQDGYHQEVKEGQEGYHQEVEEGQKGYHQEAEEGQVGYHQEEEAQTFYNQKEEGQEGHHQVVEEGQEGSHLEGQESNHQKEESQEVNYQEVEEGQEGYKVISTPSENVASEQDDKKNQSFKKDSDEEQYLGFSLNIIPNTLRFTSDNDAEAESEQKEQSNKLLAGNEQKDNSNINQEVEEGQDDYHQEVEEGQEGYHQEVEEGQEGYHQELEGQEGYHQEVEGQEGYHQEVEGQEGYHQEEEGQEGNRQVVEEGQEGYYQKLEGQEGYHQKEEGQEVHYQEVEGQVGYEVICTPSENVPSEEADKGNKSFQKDLDEEQYMGISLNIIPNNLRFTSDNDAEAEPEQKGQSNKFSDEEKETCGDEIGHKEELEMFDLNNDNVVWDEKDLKEKEQKHFEVENEIICEQSTFPLGHERDNLLLENSKVHVVETENTAENHDIDGPIEKHRSELDKIEAANNPDNENSKSEDSMDSQDISIYFQKSEDFEISKDYQLEQTLPDTTPLPNLDDEFEELADDEIILASEHPVEVTKSQCPAHSGEIEEVLDSSLESQSSQILPEESEKSNVIKDDDDTFVKESDYYEQQAENPKDLLESPENVVDPKLETEDSSATLDTEEPAAEENTQSEEPVDGKVDDENSESEESTNSQEEVTISSPKVAEFETTKDSQLEQTQVETSLSDLTPKPENLTEVQVHSSSEQLGSESVDDYHNEEPKERRETLYEDTNSESVLTKTAELVPSSEEAELVPGASPEDTKESEEYIIKEHSSSVTQVLPEESEQLNLIKESAYNRQRAESPNDLLESRHQEHFVDPKMETEDSSATLDTEEPAAELNTQSEEPVDGKVDDEKSEFEETTTSQKEVTISSQKVEEFETTKDSQLEKTQVETSLSDLTPKPENLTEVQVHSSSEQLGSESVDDYHNEEPEERRKNLNEDTNLENVLTKTIEVVPSLEETKLVPGTSCEDTTENEEYIIKEHSSLVTQDFGLELTESVDTEDHEKYFCKEEDEECVEDLTDDGTKESSTEFPNDLLETKHPEHFVDPKLETEDSSATLDSEEPAAEQNTRSEEPVDCKMDDENSESEEFTTSQEEVITSSQKIEEFETSKVSELEKSQFETSLTDLTAKLENLIEVQGELSSEQLGNESVDRYYNEEPEERGESLNEDTNLEIGLTKTPEVVPSLEDTELVPGTSCEDTTENEEYIIKEHSNLVKQDFGLELTESVDTEDHEKEFCKEEDEECVEDLTDVGTKESSTEFVNVFSGDNIISSNVLTKQEDVKVDVKPSEESVNSENDDSVTSDESSPNVSTVSYAFEPEDSKTQFSEKGDIGGDTDLQSQKEQTDFDNIEIHETHQNDPFFTPGPVQEGSSMETQTSSDEEKDLLGERSDSSFDSYKEHEDMSELTRQYSEDGKTVNGIFGHTIVQATLDLDNYMLNGHSTGQKSEIVISEAMTFVRSDGDIVKSQSQDKIEDSIKFKMSDGKSEGLFQSLLETSEHKEGRLDEASEIKNFMQAAVKYVDTAAEQSHYTKKLINPYLSERDLDEPSEIRSSEMDEDLVNTNREVNETNQGLKMNQGQEDSWSSDE